MNHEQRFLAHHFESYRQQFEAGKLGMWLFLVTEVLLFGGLFCVYTLFRADEPEMFAYGSRYLDKNLGALNTVVLIFSSFTMAWAVRAAQLGRRKLLVRLLAITLACGAVFLGVKYVEYSHKFHEGFLPGKYFYAKMGHLEDSHYATSAAADVPEGRLLHPLADPDRPLTTHHFFTVYFLMTGLHGLHVIAGMIAILWLLLRAMKGHFSAEYYFPVDLGGLYWHLVDLIWIFLFPLLYLIA